MAARGSQAKIQVINKIANLFGDDYVGEDAKGKIFVWADDGGERVQIALALTCPKVQLETSARSSGGDFDWDMDTSSQTSPQTYEKPVVTEEETARIQEMMKRLNL